LQTEEVIELTLGQFYVENDPKEAASRIISTVNAKLLDFGLPV